MCRSATPSSPFQRLTATRREEKDGRGGCLIHPGLQQQYPVLLAQLHPFCSYLMVFNLHLILFLLFQPMSGVKIAYGTSRSRFRIRTGPQAAAEGKNRGEASADSLP